MENSDGKRKKKRKPDPQLIFYKAKYKMVPVFCYFTSWKRMCKTHEVFSKQGRIFLLSSTSQIMSTVNRRVRFIRILRFSTGKHKQKRSFFFAQRTERCHQKRRKLPFWSFDIFERLCNRNWQMSIVGASFASSLFIFLPVHFVNIKDIDSCMLFLYL